MTMTTAVMATARQVNAATPTATTGATASAWETAKAPATAEAPATEEARLVDTARAIEEDPAGVTETDLDTDPMTDQE